jgi:regulator of protease activity HflC (stomatin/prohibitin superfamily)
MLGLPLGVVVAVAIVLIWMAMSVRVIQEYERGIVFFLGRYTGLKQPGLRIILVPVFRMAVVDTRTIARDVPPQDVITKDNVSVKVNAVIYFRVIQPDKAVLQVENFLYATSQLAQTTLRSVVGQHDLDQLLSERERLNDQLQMTLDQQTDPWGVKVTNVEIKHVDLPVEMQRMMARQAEAERERRAKIIAAEGEFQAARKLTDAAEVLSAQPSAIQLRYLQTLVEIGAQANTTTVFPLPIDMLSAFMKKLEKE